jgi:hypothetical protein
MILLTFDDGVHTDHAFIHKRLFSKGRLNPNQCPICATFFVSHNWTNYGMVHKLYRTGHEIASHSITHRLPKPWWKFASYADLDAGIRKWYFSLVVYNPRKLEVCFF